MSTIPDDLRQVIRELEKIQEAWKSGRFNEAGWLCGNFCDNSLDDAIKIVSDAEERLVMMEGKE